MTSFSNDDADIVIIGAGISGLTAASNLVQLYGNSPIRIVILEARDRLGGRTKTIDVASALGPFPISQHQQSIVDVGGQWVGPGQDRLLALIDKFGLYIEDQEFTVCPTYPGKKNCSLVECANFPLFSTYDGNAVIDFVTMLGEAAKEIDLEQPWTHPKAREWNAYSVQQFVTSYVSHPDAQSELLLFTQTVFACSPEYIGFFFLFSMLLVMEVLKH